jgi:type I restriction enzyme, S subunit
MSKKVTTATPQPDGQPALTPKLRFPEFRDAAGWEEKRLGDVASFLKGKGISKAEIAANGLHPCIRYGELYTRYGEVIDEVFSRTDTVEADLFFSRSNDVIIPGSGETKLDIAKASCVMHDDVALGGDLNVIRTEHNGVFLSYYFNGPKKWDIAKVAQGDTVVHLYPSQLEKLAIALPKSPEQQKIAECLSRVDELMAAQARKLDALKTHKKGLMQQLFPREGETQPRLRFPEFHSAGEWEEKPLNQVFSIFQGYAFASNDSVEQGCRWLKIADVGIQLMNPDAPSFLPTEYKESFAKFSVRKGDYVIALTRPILSGQLKIAQVDNVFDGALLNQRVGKIITSQHAAFVYFLLQSWRIVGDIEKSISGNDPPNLSAQQIEDIKTRIPKPAEQQRIANCLTSLDDLIAAQTQKLAALKTHKQGLMQQLFPSPEEVEA